MRYQEFKKEFFSEICITNQRIKSVDSKFHFNNISRWIKSGLLIRLRNGYYTFPEYLPEPGVSMYFANRIYKPSYISMQTALAFYGIIPEAVAQIKSVSSLKTTRFENRFGIFTYNTVSPDLMFGYVQKSLFRDISFLIAEPEKAILDLLYIYPFYNSAEEITELRLDGEVSKEITDREKLKEYALRFSNNALLKRLEILIKEYSL